MKFILKATYTHSKNLARFVFIYKALSLFFKTIFNELKEYHTMIAAFIGGYIVFGARNPVNEQVIILFFLIIMIIYKSFLSV